MFCFKINHDDSKLPFEELELPDCPRSFLYSCYRVLECTCIESVSTVISGLVLIIDECGKCWDGWQHRINNVASILFGSNCDLIVGDAILARRDCENLVSLTSDDVAFLKRYFPDCYFSTKASL